jgi:hypothetical protein
MGSGFGFSRAGLPCSALGNQYFQRFGVQPRARGC